MVRNAVKPLSPRELRFHVADCVRLGRFAGLLARSFSRTADLFQLSRRRRSMTLATGMKWDLLPPLTVRSA